MPLTTIEATALKPPRARLISWLPTLIWLGVIAMFSSDAFSARNTGNILLKLIHAIFGDISPQRFALLHFLIRKGAHCFTYGLLSWLSFLSWRSTLRGSGGWRIQWSGLALALTLVAASLDEFHQSFVPSRTSTPYDVLLDMTAALIIQILLAIFRRAD